MRKVLAKQRYGGEVGHVVIHETKEGTLLRLQGYDRARTAES